MPLINLIKVKVKYIVSINIQFETNKMYSLQWLFRPLTIKKNYFKIIYPPLLFCQFSFLIMSSEHIYIPKTFDELSNIKTLYLKV